MWSSGEWARDVLCLSRPVGMSLVPSWHLSLAGDGGTCRMVLKHFEIKGTFYMLIRLFSFIALRDGSLMIALW